MPAVFQFPEDNPTTKHSSRPSSHSLNATVIILGRQKSGQMLRVWPMQPPSAPETTLPHPYSAPKPVKPVLLWRPPLLVFPCPFRLLSPTVTQPKLAKRDGSSSIVPAVSRDRRKLSLRRAPDLHWARRRADWAAARGRPSNPNFTNLSVACRVHFSGVPAFSPRGSRSLGIPRGPSTRPKYFPA